MHELREEVGKDFDEFDLLDEEVAQMVEGVDRGIENGFVLPCSGLTKRAVSLGSQVVIGYEEARPAEAHVRGNARLELDDPMAFDDVVGILPGKDAEQVADLQKRSLAWVSEDPLVHPDLA